MREGSGSGMRIFSAYESGVIRVFRCFSTRERVSPVIITQMAANCSGESASRRKSRAKSEARAGLRKKYIEAGPAPRRFMPSKNIR